jgi:hypothetical protein
LVILFSFCGFTKDNSSTGIFFAVLQLFKADGRYLNEYNKKAPTIAGWGL